MSGFAAVLPAVGAPVDGGLLARMASSLAYRGPDGTRWADAGGCGLAHALLLTGDEAAPPPAQPLERGGVWIAADARIDGRAELARELRGAGISASPDDAAAELLLAAYAAWGTECLAHLLGDFSFALWDAGRRRLFCARDPFGHKLLYHARAGADLVVSNTLDCVLLHPGVDPALDDLAVADFLVHGFPQELDRTIRRHVSALPPGHALVAEDGRVRAWRWWSLPVEEPLRLHGPREYAGRFVEIFGEAVRDRTPRGRASIFLSGGKDSPSVAAFARETGTALHAFTAYYDRLIADPEREWAGVAAKALGLPVTWLAVDGYRAFERFEADPLFLRPEPVDSALMAIEADQWTQAAAHASVLLTGFGGDAVLRETRSRLARLVLGGHPLRALGEAAQYAWWHRRIPRPGVRTWRSVGSTRQTGFAEVPPWIAPDFARRTRLRERIEARNAWTPPPHPTRPEAYEQLASPLWPFLFSYQDPGVTRVPLEQRHPFFDVRLVRFLLSVPPGQWYNDKGLLRIGMHGRLPGPLLARPKTPLAGDPLRARQKAEGEGWLGGRALGDEVAPYVDAARVSRMAGGTAAEVPEALWTHLRPLALSLWLRRRSNG